MIDQSIIDEIYKHAELQKRKRRFLIFFAWVNALLSPFICWWAIRSIDESLNEHNEPIMWSSEVLRSAIENGSFWTHPLEAIFQAPYTSLADEPWQIFIVLLIAILCTFAIGALIFRIAAWLIQRIFRSRPLHALKQPQNTLLAYSFRQGIGKHANNVALWQTTSNNLPLNAQLLADTVLFSFILPKNILPLYIQSQDTIINQKIRSAITLKRTEEIILDGTTYEHFRIYSPVQHQAIFTRILTPGIAAQLVKNFSMCDILLQGNNMSIAAPLTSFSSPSSMALFAEQAHRFGKTITSGMPTIGYTELPTDTPKKSLTSKLHILAGRLRKHFRKYYLLPVLAVILGIGFTLLTLLSGNQNTSELIFTCVVTALLAIPIHVQKNMLRLRPKGVKKGNAQ